MFEAIQLRFAYNGRKPVFDDLNIRLSPGEVTGLIANRHYHWRARVLRARSTVARLPNEAHR